MASPPNAKPASFSTAEKEELIFLLHRAAEIEHVLLNAYLYAATSIKSTPEEFASCGGQANPRGAIQFEQARRWKLAMTQVARQEMMHLHFVQLMLRTLEQPPYFGLPSRSEAGGWVIGHWDDRATGSAGEESVTVDLAKATEESVMRFAAYESGDEVQDEGLRSKAFGERLDELLAFEQELLLEQMLCRMPEGDKRQALLSRLRTLYFGSAAAPPHPVAAAAPEPAAPSPVPGGSVFQSIGDLYRLRILPLFEKAFAANKVPRTNQVLQDVLQGVQTRDKDVIPFTPQPVLSNYLGNIYAPMSSFGQVMAIIDEIAEEGEGARDFLKRTDVLLKAAAAPGASRNYVRMLLNEDQVSVKERRDFARSEKIRNSHLYLFSVTAKAMAHEAKLAGGPDRFSPARAPIEADGSLELNVFSQDLAAQFNACYMAVNTWLARLYVHQGKVGNDSRRVAVSMLTTWPLMSTAIRPLMELLSFFPVDPRTLFWMGSEPEATLTPEARELASILNGLTGVMETDEPRIDAQVVRIFDRCADWAVAQQAVLSKRSFATPHIRQMILTRLTMLSQLREVGRQLPFRIQGGYSEMLPGPTFLARAGNARHYEEDAQTVSPLFKGTLVLRLRFAGWVLMPMASDPDPPSDEAGCSGYFQLHPADQRVFDRAMRWQLTPGEENILREPRGKLPEIGVNGVEVALMASASGVTAGYVASPSKHNVTGVQSSLSQQLTIEGLSEVAAIPASDITGAGRKLRFNLEDKNDLHPHLVGNNHVVWRNGETLDPFVLGVYADPEHPGYEPELVLRREVFTKDPLSPNDPSKDHSWLDLEPLERVYSARWPLSFMQCSDIPAWALPKEIAKTLDDKPPFPSYMRTRAEVLTGELSRAIDGDAAGQPLDNDAVVSLAERLRQVAISPSTVAVWLRVGLNYGHTLSGPMKAGGGLDLLLAAVEAKTGLKLQLAPPPDGDDRKSANSRWLTRYTLAVMDTDALSHMAYGELYVPVIPAEGASPFRFAREWKFPDFMSAAVAAFACNFAVPFWAEYKLAPDGASRAVSIKDQEVTETLSQTAAATGYRYSISGLQGVSGCEGTFSLTASDGQAVLAWSVTAEIQQECVVEQVAAIAAVWAGEMDSRLAGFGHPSSRAV